MARDDELRIIEPDWPAPARVRAASTTRTGGVSRGAYASLNLGAHVGDEPTAVAENRARLRRQLRLPAEPQWLNQVHGAGLAWADGSTSQREADAMLADEAGQVCAVLTADCLPILLCDPVGLQVAAVHAGWRGLAADIVGAVVRSLGEHGAQADALFAWLGPAIGPDAYEVGTDVHAAFSSADPGHSAAFRPSRPGHWWLDLYAAARLRLMAAGVTQIFGGEHCTLSSPQQFFSHRRDGHCGRQATLIWLD